MKKSAGFIIAVIFIVVAVFVYLKIGKKGAEVTKTYVETSAGYINDAQTSVDALNKSTEEAKKTADRMLGK
jgi:H+/gluconate symporter-like permease